MQPDTGVLTITGTGLGADLVVIVDGQPATVLPGATSTRLDVQPPATVLTTPGTYRLTRGGPGATRRGWVCRRQSGQPRWRGHRGRQHSIDPARSATPRRLCLEAASRPPQRCEQPQPSRRTPSPMVYRRTDQHRHWERGRSWSNTTGTLQHRQRCPGAHSRTRPVRIEHGPRRAHALSSNTTGSANTASGAAALGSNTTGRLQHRQRLRRALIPNTTGSFNTATGASRALLQHHGDDQHGHRLCRALDRQHHGLSTTRPPVEPGARLQHDGLRTTRPAGRNRAPFQHRRAASTPPAELTALHLEHLGLLRTRQRRDCAASYEQLRASHNVAIGVHALGLQHQSATTTRPCGVSAL